MTERGRFLLDGFMNTRVMVVTLNCVRALRALGNSSLTAFVAELFPSIRSRLGKLGDDMTVAADFGYVIATECHSTEVYQVGP
jgi:hypothetical protein